MQLPDRGAQVVGLEELFSGLTSAANDSHGDTPYGPYQKMTLVCSQQETFWERPYTVIVELTDLDNNPMTMITEI